VKRLNHALDVALSAQEWKDIVHATMRLGMTPSDYLRQPLGLPVEDRQHRPLQPVA
jgi:hypothetical protein